MEDIDKNGDGFIDLEEYIGEYQLEYHFLNLLAPRTQSVAHVDSGPLLRLGINLLCRIPILFIWAWVRQYNVLVMYLRYKSVSFYLAWWYLWTVGGHPKLRQTWWGNAQTTLYLDHPVWGSIYLIWIIDTCLISVLKVLILVINFFSNK